MTKARELGAGLGNHNVLAVGVRNGLHVLLVRVPVDHQVDARGLGNQSVAAPALVVAGLAQVGEKNHVIGAVGCARGLGKRLYHGVENLGVVLEEAPNKVAVLVLEQRGVAARQGRGGHDAQVRDFDRLACNVVLNHVIGVELQVSAGIGKVAAHVLERGLRRGKIQEVLDAKVKLVVAHGHHVVVACAFDLHGNLAVAGRAQHAALNGVTSVYQRDVARGVGLFLGFDKVDQGAVAQVGLGVVHAAVDVVGVDDGDLLGDVVCAGAATARLFCKGAGRTRGQREANAC